MYIGIDIGTSGVKAILMDEHHRIMASHTEPLTISRPHSLWSEQDPLEWWQATCTAISALKEQQSLAAVLAIGLTGQMHGATLLDKKQQVLRPAILWNDGRCEAECQLLEQLVPNSQMITGNIMMPGFTAPKIKWMERNEKELFEQIDKVLLPKDFIRLKMTGEMATDMSDAAGTMWLNVAKRDWNNDLLEACGLTRNNMPTLFEGNEITGYLKAELAKQWGLKSVPVIAGGGDNAAGAIGVGLSKSGQGMMSLGTSGVYFVVTDQFYSKPEQAVHSFCHALPQKWHLMSVMLSAASCLTWACKILEIADVSTLFKQIELTEDSKQPIYFLPYLSGERTPHNNPNATGVLFGLTHNHSSIDIARAIVQGVSYSLVEGMEALHSSGIVPNDIIIIGGGARSRYWRQLLSDVSGYSLQYRQGSEVGPALGAAKLAQLASHPEQSVDALLYQPKLVEIHYPDRVKHEQYNQRRTKFRELYQHLLPMMTN